MAPDTATLSDRMPARIGAVVDLGRDAGAFAAQQQGVAGLERHVGEGRGTARREQHDPARHGCDERVEVGVTADAGGHAIIHRGARHRPVAEGKAHRFDQVEADVHTGGEAHQRTHVAGDIGLVKGKAHRDRPIAR
jgi:hypothetical protein